MTPEQGWFLMLVIVGFITSVTAVIVKVTEVSAKPQYRETISYRITDARIQGKPVTTMDIEDNRLVYTSRIEVYYGFGTDTFTLVNYDRPHPLSHLENMDEVKILTTIATLPNGNSRIVRRELKPRTYGR